MEPERLDVDEILRRVGQMPAPRVSESADREIAELVAAMDQPEFDRLLADARLAVEERQRAGDTVDALLTFARLGMALAVGARS